MKRIIHFLLVILALLYSSCGSNERTLVESSGGLNEVIIVCDDSLWEDGLSKRIIEIFQDDFEGLPQPEPRFVLSRVSHKNFGYLLKLGRTICLFHKNKSPRILFSKNIYAKPQRIVSIQGPNLSSVISLLNQNKDSILEYFEESTIQFITNNLKKLSKLKHKTLVKQNVNIKIPDSYIKVEDSNNFLWFRKATDRGQLNIIVYIAPITNDSDYSGSSLIAERDSIARNNIFGGAPGSYMKTEIEYFPPKITLENWNGNIIYKMRGLWKMNGEFRGGPFLSYSWIDEKNERIVTVEGFAYAPNLPKRNLMLELEGILNSFNILN